VGSEFKAAFELEQFIFGMGARRVSVIECANAFLVMSSSSSATFFPFDCHCGFA